MPIKKRDSLIIGAAIGVGSAAQAAERGGADFLLALAVGRYRVMGAASSAAILPIGSSNGFTNDFARREILGRVGIPVFFGANASDPREDLDALVHAVASAGYSGIANFPTCIHVDGRLREALEAQGLGLAREASLLEKAKAAGLASLAYAKTRLDIDRLLSAAPIDILCINFGWNAGGSRGVPGQIGLDEAARKARHLIQRARKSAPAILCVVEGGPIISPADMTTVCRRARADGYLGGSTLDRLPLELSVIQSTSAFKFAGFGGGSGGDPRELVRLARLTGLAGQSESFRQTIDAIARFASNDLPLLICGESGVGKTALARAMHLMSGRAGAIHTIDPGEELSDESLAERDCSIIIRAAERLDSASLLRLAAYLKRHRWSRGDAAPRKGARIIATVKYPGRISGTVAGLFSDGVIAIPPLRERPTDIAPQVKAMLRALCRDASAGPVDLSVAAYRALLERTWSGNSAELRAVIERAARAAENSELIEPHHLPPEGRGAAPPTTILDMQRRTLLAALEQNGFRRNETAIFLGISRKTLYNRMKRHGLTD